MWILSVWTQAQQRLAPRFSLVNCTSKPESIIESKYGEKVNDGGETPKLTSAQDETESDTSGAVSPTAGTEGQVRSQPSQRLRIPWNRGKKLPEQLRKKIKARTIEAHRRPDVVLRVLRRDQRPGAEPLPKIQIVGSAGPLEFSTQDLKRMKWNWDTGEAEPVTEEDSARKSAEAQIESKSSPTRKKRSRKPANRPPPEIFHFEPVQMTNSVIRRMAHDVRHKLLDSSYLDAFEGKTIKQEPRWSNRRR
jgi:hypothetical protein